MTQAPQRTLVHVRRNNFSLIRAWVATLGLAGGVGAPRCVWAQSRPAPSSPIVVTTRVPVTVAGSGSYWWADLTAAPDDARRLLVCGTVTAPGRQAAWGFVSVSDDAGASWQSTLLDSTSAWVSEESCAYGSGGTAYFVAGASHVIAGELHHEVGTMHVFRSADGGHTWILRQRGLWLDYTGSVIDSASGRLSVFANDMATSGGTWVTRRGPFLLTSRDSGATFADSAVAAWSGGKRGAYPSGVAQLVDGSVVAAAATDERVPLPARNRQSKVGSGDSVLMSTVSAFLSRDGGRTLEEATVWRDAAPLLGWPAVAVDRSHGPHRGRVYVAWGGSTSHSAASRRGAVVMLAVSDDQGRTWTRRPVTEVHTQADTAAAPRSWQYATEVRPTLAVNSAGVVALAWTDVAARCTRFTLSRDGGTTFVPAVQLSHCGLPVRKVWFADNYLVAFPGRDSAGVTTLAVRVDFETARLWQQNMVADAAGAFHPTWGEYTSAGVQLWTATVWADPPPVDRALSTAGLVDRSRDVAVDVEQTGYDPVGRDVWLNATLVNLAATTVRGPVRLVLTRLELQQSGPAVAVNATNGRSGVGALWDATSAIPAGGLPPQGRSQAVHLRFRLLRAPLPGVTELFSPKFHVYGGAQ